MRVGFIGLGQMGQAIARNLLKAGHELVVYNRTPSRADALRADGARVASTPAEACAREVVMTMLADDRAVEELLLGKSDGQTGALAALPKGAVHVSLGTISVDLSRRLAQTHAAQGQGFVAAPVFGRPDAAAAATLVVVTAGPAEQVERCRPLLKAIGRQLFVVGAEPHLANVIKLTGNFMIAATLETLGEAFAFLRKLGVDPSQFLEIVNGSLFRSPMYESYGRMIAESRYQPAGFALPLGLKDVRLLLAAADAAQVPTPVASVIREHMLSGLARGMEQSDWSTIARVIAENAGLEG